MVLNNKILFANCLLYVFLLIVCNVYSVNSTASVSVPEVQAKDTLALAKEWFKKAAYFDGEGNLEKSNEAAQQALRLATVANDHLLMGRAMNLLAINLSIVGKREEGISLSFQAFDQLMLAGDTVRASNVKINIGMDYNNHGKYEEALKTELEALDLRLQCGDSSNIATYYQHIGEVYKQLGIRDKWKSSLETAQRLSQNPKYASFATQIGILNDIGGIHEAEKQYDEAIKVYQEMYSRSKQEDFKNGMATALNNLSPVYLSLGQNEKALNVTEESLRIQESTNNFYGQLCAHNQLGEVFLALGRKELSHKHFLKGLELAEEQHYIHEQKISLDGLYRISREQGNWKDALIYHEKYIQLNDSLQNIELQEKLTNIETKYQTEKKEQQIELLNSENELKSTRIKVQNMGIWGGSIIILIAALLAVFIIRHKRRQQLALQNELEQKLLRSQMNPHFIFNSLGAIQSFMFKNDGRKAAFYLSSFSSLMRSILKNSREEQISLLEERQTLENYLHLQQLRLGEKMSFSVTVSDKLDEESVALPPMLLQPFVENAIIHGIEKMEENGHVAIAFGKVDEQLKITVSDNGKGLSDKDQKGSHVSYALQIFKERVANLKKTSGIEIEYRIENHQPDQEQNSGTLVTVLLPLNLI